MARRMRMRKRKRSKSRPRYKSRRKRRRRGKKVRFRRRRRGNRTLNLIKRQILQPSKWFFADEHQIRNMNFGQSQHSFITCWTRARLDKVHDDYWNQVQGVAAERDYQEMMTANRKVLITMCNNTNYKMHVRVYAVYAGKKAVNSDFLTKGRAIMTDMGTTAGSGNTLAENDFNFDFTHLRHLKYYFKTFVVAQGWFEPSAIKTFGNVSRREKLLYGHDAVEYALPGYLVGYYIRTIGQPLHDTADNTSVSSGQVSIDIIKRLSCDVYKALREAKQLIKSTDAAEGFDAFVGDGEVAHDMEVGAVDE